MQTVIDPAEARRASAELRSEGRTLALVPTMGALHRAHLTLIEQARSTADRVAVSIFVNPSQFNSADDLKHYPRTLEADLKKCSAAGVDLVFTPQTAALYQGLSELTSTTKSGLTIVQAGRAAQGLCGAARPAHFDGVATIVTILFNLLDPDVAIFGEKDYQQLRVIQALVRDLHLRVRIDAAPLVREPDGLAMSSRNVRLSAEERYSALYLPRTLLKLQQIVLEKGLRSVRTIAELTRDNLEKAPALTVDYVEVVDRYSLRPLEEIETAAQLLAAVYCGPVRLIDNIMLEPSGAGVATV